MTTGRTGKNGSNDTQINDMKINANPLQLTYADSITFTHNYIN